MKTIILTRTEDNGVQATGNIRSSDGFFGRFTLERPWKGNKPNISCIPPGEYLVQWTFSWKLMRRTFQVMNVPSRSGIRIHPGNYFFDIEGCILLGSGYLDMNHDGKKDIINSKKTTREFEAYMGYKDFLLKIVKGYN